MNAPKRVAIITARGGSKRIPRKNIRPFQGKPILSYSIAAALEAGIFQEVMVSTEDHEIAELAARKGAKVPFFRSAKNSDDHSTTADVIREVLDTYSGKGMHFDQFCCLYPTAPFVTAEKLRLAATLLETSEASMVVPVVRFGFPIQRALKLEGKFLRMMQPENLTVRSQDLPPAFHDSGQFYFGKVPDFLASHKLFGEKTLALIVPESEVQDIDNEEDWKIAELKYELMSRSKA